jgi:inorganic pyrophosphatase
MVPRTLAEDGDPLDVIVLGRGIERAHIAKTRVIGVLEMADPAGTRDDKLVAVPVEAELENGFSRLHELAELDEWYPASREILYLWFTNYWGRGATNVLGWGDAGEAREILERSKVNYQADRARERPRRRDGADLHPAAHSPCVARDR